MTRLGIVGLGTMGLAITARLQEAGVTVSGHDIAASVREPFIGCGGEWAGSIPQLCTTTDTILILVQSATQVRTVLTEIANSKSGPLLCLIGATIRPDDVTSFAADMPERVRLLDAPMAGAVQAAESGQLVFFVGGDAADYERSLDILDLISAQAPLVGGLGTGQVVKAVNSLMLHAARAGVDEAMYMLETWGHYHPVDFAAATAAMAATTGDSWSLRNRAFTQRYTGPRWTVKDLEITLDLAVKLGATAPVARYLRDYFAEDINSVW